MSLDTLVSGQRDRHIQTLLFTILHVSRLLSGQHRRLLEKDSGNQAAANPDFAAWNSCEDALLGRNQYVELEINRPKVNGASTKRSANQKPCDEMAEAIVKGFRVLPEC